MELDITLPGFPLFHQRDFSAALYKSLIDKQHNVEEMVRVHVLFKQHNFCSVTLVGTQVKPSIVPPPLPSGILVNQGGQSWTHTLTGCVYLQSPDKPGAKSKTTTEAEWLITHSTMRRLKGDGQAFAKRDQEEVSDHPTGKRNHPYTHCEYLLLGLQIPSTNGCGMERTEPFQSAIKARETHSRQHQLALINRFCRYL